MVAFRTKGLKLILNFTTCNILCKFCSEILDQKFRNALKLTLLQNLHCEGRQNSSKLFIVTDERNIYSVFLVQNTTIVRLRVTLEFLQHFFSFLVIFYTFHFYVFIFLM